MPEEDKSSSWPGFLSELSKGFLILRDVFGYALPGAIFLGVGLICRRFSLRDLQYYILQPYHPPAWLAAVVGLGACYAVGHVMAAVAYFPYNFKKETEVSSDLILARAQHPELLIELDRQSTMTMMRGSTGAALLLGSIFFWWLPKTPPLGWMLAGAGILLLVVFYWSAMPHIGRLAKSTSAAAASADISAPKPAPAPPPNLHQVLHDAAATLADNLKKL
jgi:amino acid transporter